MAYIQFSSRHSTGGNAIVVSFDLCGFSDFCNQADAYAVLPRFIAAVFDEVDRFFLGWLDATIFDKDFENDKLSPPDFIKYTGDGALMIWLLPDETQRRQAYCTAIVKAMHELQKRFLEIIPQWEIEWQVHRLPSRARFGIAKGLVYPLRGKSGTMFDGEILDYAGYCINLAVRLQNHCPEIGFIIHEPIFPKLEGLLKFIAHSMKGTRSEPVLMFVSDIPSLSPEYLKSKFQPCGPESELRSQATNREYKTLSSGLGTMGKGTKENPVIGQPRFEAVFVGPGNWRQDGYLDEPLPEYIPIRDVPDTSGKIHPEKHFFKLISNGPPLIYEFVRREPL